MDSKSQEFLSDVYTYLNTKFFKYDGVQLLTKEIDVKGISVITFTYNNQMGISLYGEILQFKNDKNILYKNINKILEHINYFYVREINFNHANLHVELKQIDVHGYKYIIIFEK